MLQAQPDEDSEELPRSEFFDRATWAEALAAVNASAVVVPMWKVNGPTAVKY